MALSYDDSLFRTLLDAPAPPIIREIPSEDTPTGITLREVVFESRIPSPDSAEKPRANEVYALISAPTGEGPFPGILLLHGGMGHADRAETLTWAARGYVVVTPDLPGIADPEKVPHSKGEWISLGYGANRWIVEPNISHSTIYQGLTAALQAFSLLRDDPRSDATLLGVTGTSWGGYSSTMLSALLGMRVRAAFSNYGSGFYEDTTFASALNSSPATGEAWLHALDAGRRAGNISAAFFIAGATNDTFFYPPAVEKTLAAIPKETNRVHAPNAHHALPIPGGVEACGGSAAMAAEWFAWHLQGKGSPFPTVTIVPQDQPQRARFHVASSEPPSSVSVWWSLPAPDDKWPQRVWNEIPAEACGDSEYQASLPTEGIKAGLTWFALVSEPRGVSASSSIQYLKSTAHGPEVLSLSRA